MIRVFLEKSEYEKLKAERDEFKATLEYMRTCLETPETTDPRTRNDMTKHRLNGVIAQMYSTICISLGKFA